MINNSAQKTEEISHKKSKKPPPWRRFSPIGLLSTLLLLVFFLIMITISLWVFFDIGGILKKISPDPTPSMPTLLLWEDPQLGVISDRHIECSRRMGELLGRSACDVFSTMEGAEVRCPMEAPFQSLTFGCGPTPSAAPQERIRLVLSTPSTLKALLAPLGACKAEAVGPAAEELPRWIHDPGEVACFFVGEFFDLGRGASFPRGVYLEYPPSTRLPLNRDLPPNALVFNSGMLSSKERSKLQAAMEMLFNREGYARSSQSRQAEILIKEGKITLPNF